MYKMKPIVVLFLAFFLYQVQSEQNEVTILMFGACGSGKCLGFPINVPINVDFGNKNKLFIETLDIQEIDFLKKVAKNWDKYSWCGQTNKGVYDSDWYIFEAKFNDRTVIEFGPSGRHQRAKRIIDAWKETDGPPASWR